MELNPEVVRRTLQGLWLVFIGYWIINAFGNKKAIYRQSRLSRLFYLIGTVLVIYLITRLQPLAVRGLQPSIATQIVGMLLCAAGFSLAIWSRRMLGGNWSGIVSLKEDHVLIRQGPYRFVRHPIYSGVILATAGTFLALEPGLRGLICFVFVFVGLRLKSLMEERILSRHFPHEYPQYMHDVKALIPFLY